MQRPNNIPNRNAQGPIAERARRQAARKASPLRHQPCGRWSVDVLRKSARLVRREIRP